MSINVINDYNNTEELLKQFKILYPTPVTTEMEKNIQNRLLTGFANWNQGFETWKAWGDILYVPESLYNLYDIHLTLKEYQTSQMVGLAKTDMQLGDFQNMLICDDWTAIRYSCKHIDRETGAETDTNVMEFVRFKDFGESLGTRVDEGFASIRNHITNGMMNFINDEEKKAQLAFFEKIENYQIPETDDLEKKYPVLHPTTPKSENAEEMKQMILKEFEAWNQGAEAFEAFAAENYSASYIHRKNVEKPLGLNEYKKFAETETEKVTRLYLDEMLISADWAAIHYRTTTINAEGKKEATSAMEFLHFETVDGSLKITECFTM